MGVESEANAIQQSWQEFWIQPDGVGTRPRRVGCVDLDTITEPKGDITTQRCWNPVTRQWEVIGRMRGEPGDPTLSVTELMGLAETYLEKLSRRGCAFPVYVLSKRCPSPVFGDWERATVMRDGTVTQKTRGTLLAMSPSGSSTLGYDVSGEAVTDLFEVEGYESLTGEAEPLHDIAICGEDQCGGICGDEEEPCDFLWAVGEGAAAAEAVQVYSTDGGATWSNPAADPFAVDEDIYSVVCFQVGTDTTRVLVVRSSTDGGNPAEVAYTDDLGATWTTVNVGSTNGEYALHSGALCALDMYHIWLATDQGNVYFSDDGGATWAAQSTGTAVDLNYVRFVSEDVGVAVGGETGASHVLIYTLNGGENWTTVTFTGPGATEMAWCVGVIDSQRWFVGFEDGSLYKTTDRGATWSAIGTLATPSGSTGITDVFDVYCWDELNIWICGNTTTAGGNQGFMQRSVNGGYDWEAWDTEDLDAALGLQGLAVCGPNHAVAVGDEDGGDSVFLEAVNA